MVNPFSDQAKGARIPDDDSAFSTSFQLRTTVHLTTLTGNTAAITIQANPSALYRQVATFTGTVINTWGALAPATDYTAFTTQFSKYRVVSMGARFYSTAAPLNQSGQYRAVVTGALTGNGVDINGGLWSAVANDAVNGLDLHWVSKPSGVDWKQYKLNNATHDYDSLTVLFTGLPDAATVPQAIACEIIMNVEVITENNSVVSAMTKPGAKPDRMALDAAAHVHSRHKGVHASKPSMFSQLANMAKGALLDVASSAMPVAGNALKRMLGVSSYPQYPMIVD